MSVVMSRLGLARADRLLLAAATVAVLLAGLLSVTRVSVAVVFVVSGIALAVLTALVARSADRLGERFGPRTPRTPPSRHGRGALPLPAPAVLGLLDQPPAQPAQRLRQGCAADGQPQRG